MSKMRLYQLDCGEPDLKTMTIKVSEINQVIDFTNTDYVRNSNNPVISDGFIKGYIKWLEDEGETHNLDMINEFSTSIGTGDFNYCSDHERSEDWDIIGTTWGNLEDKMNLKDLEEIDIYEWHDGSNWKIEWLDGENGWQEVCEYDDEELNFIDIDEHDGNDFYTGNKFYHVKIAKMEDGNYITDEYSQWQGSHPSGQLLEGKEELKTYLESVDRSNYFDKIV